MTGGETALIALSALFAVDAAWSRWRSERLVRHLSDLLASRSYAEWAAGQKKVALAEYAKKQGEKDPQTYNNLF